MVTEEQILEVIASWNKSILNQNLRERSIVDGIIKLHNKGKNKEIIDLVGVRRAGKSSILALITRKNLEMLKNCYFNERFK